jgi:hypothetical protein
MNIEQQIKHKWLPLVILMTLLATTAGCIQPYTPIVTCDNGFVKEAKTVYIENNTVVSKHPTTVYTIPHGVTCVRTYKEIDK